MLQDWVMFFEQQRITAGIQLLQKIHFLKNVLVYHYLREL